MSEPPPNLRPDAFAGLADDYLRYRPPYPPEMLDALLDDADLRLGGRLLDLACGPGRVALAIADRFSVVWAVDRERDMVEAGRREAARLGIGGIRWHVGPAEAFEAPAAAFDLITIGEAFHRLDRPRIAALAYRWLRPGGALVTLGYGLAQQTAAPWRRVVDGIIRDFVGDPARRLGAPNTNPADELADQEQAMRDAGFVELARHAFDVPHEWTVETLLGAARSNSTLSRRALGERHAAFEAAVTKALHGSDAGGSYREIMSCGYTVARRP
jgi:ubiquinone/menaquinone biosynthesis C-methylase UbiE